MHRCRWLIAYDRALFNALGDEAIEVGDRIESYAAGLAWPANAGCANHPAIRIPSQLGCGNSPDAVYRLSASPLGIVMFLLNLMVDHNGQYKTHSTRFPWFTLTSVVRVTTSRFEPGHRTLPFGESNSLTIRDFDMLPNCCQKAWQRESFATTH